jgi:hypothetical protein
MIQRGTDEEGYGVEWDETTPALRVKVWGFWSQSTADSFAQSVIDSCGTAPRGLTIIIDAIGLKPQREVGQKAFGMLMTALARLAVKRVDVTTDSSLAKLQLLRLAQENGAKRIFHFHEPKSQT